MRILKIDSLPNAKQWVDREHMWLNRKNDNEFDNDDEDNEMLNRLMKIHLGLWT